MATHWKKIFAMSVVLFWMLVSDSLCNEILPEREHYKESGEYCQSETFQPRCLRNEVILMRTATYGRMRIGRCVKAEEVAAHRSSIGGDESRYLGCSANVLSLLDQKCSGKRSCDVRVIQISDENIYPCFPGLNMHLEASYDCITVVDEERSCHVTASKTVAHLISSSDTPNVCGTISQPWIIEVPAGQRIKMTLLDFTSSPLPETRGQKEEFCQSYGVIVDKPGKRNSSICAREERRITELHVSIGNVLTIFIEPSGREDWRFVLGFEAVGCSEMIPPEDTWLKRNEDAIVIGCYSSRQTWRLTCSEGKWIGVLGNCSQDSSVPSLPTETEVQSSISKEEQVLAMVAIVGCTLAICLAIICIGAVCLRRFHVRAKKKQANRVLNFTINSARSHNFEKLYPSGSTDDSSRSTVQGMASRQEPNYAVYVGHGDSDQVGHLMN